MAATWVMVANGGAARLFRAESPLGVITELESIVHPEGRMRVQDLTSDIPGRAFDSAGQGRHAMESEVGPRRQALREFAGQLAARLERARRNGEMGRLVIAAAPGFLGELRKAISTETRRLVAHEIDRDLVRLSPQEIRAHLPERLYSTLGR